MGPAPVAVLRTNGLSKSYSAVRALDNVSFEVPAGSIFGVLGPNGSGKTTLLGTVLGVLLPTEGTFSWFDQGVRNQRKRIGTLLETPNFYPYLTATENLEITASIRGRGRETIASVLEQVGLSSYQHLAFGKFSLGMKQRLAIGATLIGEPEVVVLDEPTNGLDPSGIADIRKLVRQIHQQGRTILLASHLLDEVEKVCTHVAILKKGKLLETGPLEDVLREDATIEIGAPSQEALRVALESFQPPLKLDAREHGFLVRGSPGLTPQELNRHCFEKGVSVSHLVPRKRNLESRFFELTDAT